MSHKVAKFLYKLFSTYLKRKHDCKNVKREQSLKLFDDVTYFHSTKISFTLSKTWAVLNGLNYWIYRER